MPWVTITEADLLARKMSPLMSVLRSAVLAPGQSDPVDEIVRSVTTRVRVKVASCATNRVDSDATKIPASLLDLACRLIIIGAKNRLEQDLTEGERQQWTIDERELNAVASCALVVEQPEEPVTPPVQVVQPGPSIRGRRPQFKRWQQSGA